MQEDAYKLKLEMLEDILEHYRDEYDQLTQKWRDIETKAQGTLSVSGVLITISGLFVREINSTFPSDMKLILAIAVTFLFLTVNTAVLVLIVQAKFLIPTGAGLENMTIQLLDFPDEELSLRRLNLIQDQHKIWKLVLLGNNEAYNLKAKRLFVSQCLLLTSLFMITIIVIRSVF